MIKLLGCLAMSSALTPLSKIRYLSSRVIGILGCNPSPVTLLGTNTYLVGSGTEKILIDTGDADVEEYQGLLKKVLDDTKSVISQIIITHYHHDHIGGLSNIRKLCKKDIPAFKMDFKTPDLRTANTYTEGPINFIADNHQFTVEGATLTAKYNPGHTNDHMVLWLEEEKALFSGDTILGEGTTIFTNFGDYMKSLKDIKALKPELIYPGHGPVIEDTAERIDYYISHRQSREDEVIGLLQENDQSALSIVEVLYKDYPVGVHGAAAHVILLHLQKLQGDGQAKCKGAEGDIDSMWCISSSSKL